MLCRSIIVFLLLTGSLSLQAQELKLFSQEIHDAANYHQQVVMDFLERYFGKEVTQKQGTTLEHKLADDRVYFRQGSIADIRQVTDTIPFSINLHDRYYEVQWYKDMEPFITIVFPAQYNLLMGVQQDEAQQQLKDIILRAPVRTDSIAVPDSLVLLHDSIYESKTEKFELESLNDAVYYQQTSDGYKPVWSEELLSYSAANLFHGLCPNTDFRMYVEQSVYGMKTIGYTLQLNQWLNYCAQLGMKIFFGVEEEREDGLLAIVITQSKELGYNHLLSVVIPDKIIGEKDAVLKVRLTPLIPTHNIKNLYQKETANKERVIWK